MIFKVVRGISLPVVGDLWNSKATQSESISAALDTTNTFAGHVKNRVVMNWQKFNPKEVRKSTVAKLTVLRRSSTYCI